MLIRLLRETEIAGRRARANAIVSLPPEEAAALIDGGLAAPYGEPAPPPSTPAPAADQPE